MTDRFIDTQNLYRLVEGEPYVLVASLLAIARLFYKFFLKEVSPERHRNLQNHFSSLIRQFLALSGFFVFYLILENSIEQVPGIVRILPYFALITFVIGNIVFVKTCRLIVLQYLFLGSMKQGVPLLLVNIFTLILSMVLGFWSVSHIFQVQLTPLLATSAAFSIILGMAMQDTLGNLFAGLSLQIDKNFEIGDWLEVLNGVQKGIGQVKEITWRSTVLVGLSDEIVTIPNRVMAQAQISNFSPTDQPIIRSQIFRVRFQTDLEKAKELLEKALVDIPEIRTIPPPQSYVHEVNENWIALKLYYYTDHFGIQFTLGGKVNEACLRVLDEAKIELAREVLEISRHRV